MRERPSLEFLVEALIASAGLGGRVAAPCPVNWIIGALRNAHRDGHTLTELAAALDIAAGATCDIDRMTGAQNRQVQSDGLLDLLEAARAIHVRVSSSIANLQAGKVPFLRISVEQARRLVADVAAPNLFWVTVDNNGEISIG